MNTLKRKIHTMLHTPRIFMKKFEHSLIFPYLPDKLALQIQYNNRFLKPLDLENPQTYNEKLQWLKLYNRHPEYTKMVDKYAVKAYVASVIGSEYIIPTYGVWEHFDDIDFQLLPEQFVLKCTHGSGDVVICKDKCQLNLKEARIKLERSLRTDYYKISREWPYKNVKPQIIAEKYLEDDLPVDERAGASVVPEDIGLTDYKIYCFNGEAKMLLIASDRFSERETKFDYFDKDFHRLDFDWTHPRSDTIPKKPKQFDEMFALAEKLSKDIAHVRVDFYETGGKIYFGELTFFHASGFEPFFPSEWDKKIGDWLLLPTVKTP